MALSDKGVKLALRRDAKPATAAEITIPDAFAEQLSRHEQANEVFQSKCAMAQRENAWQLTNVVQLDDADLGGELSGGTAGRGSENKVPFVAAVSLNEKGHPQYLKLTQVAGFTREAIKQWAQAHLATGTIALSDGLGCFAGVLDAGCRHLPIVVGGRKPRDTPEFKWVNTLLGNLKATLAGAHHAFKYRKCAAHHLGAFAYRFNRRFPLPAVLPAGYPWG